MNQVTPTPSRATSAQATSLQDAPAAAQAQAQHQQALLHRFRHALRAGQSSPLLHLVLRHRQETVSCMQAI